MSRPSRLARRIVGVACLATLAVAAPGTAGLFNDPVQDCDPNPGNPTTGRWYSNGVPGQRNNVVTGYKEDGGTFYVLAENTGTDAEGSPFTNVIQCGSLDTNWRLFLSHAGDRADTVRVDAVGLSDSSFGPIPSRIEARLFGGSGRDDLLGHDGKNTLNGGKGGDELRSFGRRDRLVGGPGEDLILAGDGRDVVRARDDARDKVLCGPGEDVAYVDRKDDVSGCETVLAG